MSLFYHIIDWGIFAETNSVAGYLLYMNIETSPVSIIQVTKDVLICLWSIVY